MKYTVTDTDKPKVEITAGMLVKGVSGGIVLVTKYDPDKSQFSGMCLNMARPYVSDGWISSAFAPFEGSITLEND